MPRPKVFTVGLSAADGGFLVELTTSGTRPARMMMRARVLLELDKNAGPVADRRWSQIGREIGEHRARGREAVPRDRR